MYKIGNRTMRIFAVAVIIVLGTSCAATESRESTGQYTDSSVLTAKVKSALARDSISSLYDISVETFRDVVQLSGFVNSEKERLHAEEVAQEVPGVVRVENSILLKPAS